MSQYQAINPKVEVNGQTVLTIVNAMGSMKSLALKILSENGINDPQPEGWYLQQYWLNAFKQIAEKIGINTLRVIGTSIPKNAEFPPHINDIHKALSSIDVAYHMNHRLYEALLFDPATGKMREGIGHYEYKKISENEVQMICNNPYPCNFDIGIIDEIAKKFKPSGAKIIITHNNPDRCRTNGSESCTYTVSW